MNREKERSGTASVAADGYTDGITGPLVSAPTIQLSKR